MILWRLEEPHLSADLAKTEPDRWLRFVVHEAKAAAVWLSFSTGSLAEWVRRVRRVEAEGGSDRSERIRVVAMVQTEATARELLALDGVDAIVAQGQFRGGRPGGVGMSLCRRVPSWCGSDNFLCSCIAGTESGGHGPTHTTGSPLHTLLTSLAPHFAPSSPPFLLAAGGLSAPSSIHSALSLSPAVAGIVPGTVLSVATSSLLPVAQKELLVRTADGEGGTTRGLRWDEARGTNGWPGWCDGRGVRNLTSDEGEAEGGTRDERVERYRRAVDEGDVQRVVTWAGALVSLSFRTRA